MVAEVQLSTEKLNFRLQQLHRHCDFRCSVEDTLAVYGKHFINALCRRALASSSGRSCEVILGYSLKPLVQAGDSTVRRAPGRGEQENM